MHYLAPTDEMLFLIEHVCNVKRLQEHERFSHLDIETIRTILLEVSRLSANELEPLNTISDKSPPKLDGGKVICPNVLKGGYNAIAEGGWIGMSGSSKYGGMELPAIIRCCINEMLGSACLSLSLNSLMTQGQIEALENHASDELKALYLPHLISGKWSGTMNLTEELAGSDVGALRAQAILAKDGTYLLTGQKIYISWGDHDLTENICHLVLARLPNSEPGTKGISLFLVPKYLIGPDGKPSTENNLETISIEKKMGLHGSPTATINYQNAKAWLIGEPNRGMAAMFTMMNNARLGVAVEGVSQAERAYQMALSYSKNRKQGKTLIADGTGSIIDHADVRRNLLTMKLLTMVARAICLDTAISSDIGRNFDNPEMSAKAAFLTPIAKAFCTEVGCQVSDIGIQVHGGLGYIEASGAAQLYRDARVTAIYEGTNGIQAMDLVNRKLSDGGVAARGIIDEVSQIARFCREKKLFNDRRIREINSARKSLVGALDWMLASTNLNDRYAGATPFLKAFGYVLGANYFLSCAIADPSADRIESTNFYVDHILPKVFAATKSARSGAGQLYSIDL